MIEIRSSATELEQDWWDLWERDPDATVFQTPAWLLPWARHFDRGQSRILVIWRGSRLVGLLPLFRQDYRLLPWGAGLTDRLGGAFDPELQGGQIKRGLAELGEPMDLFQLHPRSALLRAPVPDGWWDRQGLSEPCLELALPAKLSGRMRQNIRTCHRRAARAGFGLPERVGPEAFANLVDLHGRRWRERGQAGVLSDTRVLAWHREALPALHRAGLLRLYLLHHSGQPAAALYALYSKKHAFYYIGGFDPLFAALGLGNLLVEYAICQATREGARVFDFLRGQEPYKYRWGAAVQPTRARFIAPPGTLDAQ